MCAQHNSLDDNCEYNVGAGKTIIHKVLSGRIVFVLAKEHWELAKTVISYVLCYSRWRFDENESKSCSL